MRQTEITTLFRCAFAALVASTPSLAFAISDDIDWRANDTALSAEFAALSDAPRSGNDPIEYLLDRTEINLLPDTIDTRETMVLRFHDKEAIANNGNQAIYFTQGIDKITVFTALVIAPDGTINRVEPDTVQVTPYETYEVFSNDMVVTIPLPKLSPGAVAVLVWESSSARDRMMTRWSRVFYPQYIWPKHRHEVKVTWADSVPAPRVGQVRDYAHGCKSTSDRVLVCVRDDIPPVEQDPNVNYRDVMQQFVIGESQNWSDVSERFNAYLARGRDDHETVRETALSLTEGLEQPRDKLDAILEFVSRDIRYVGLEHGASTHVPRPASVTLARRYGDCKDKTALMLDMLATAGIQAQPVFVATNRTRADNLAVPSGRYFNHVIACGNLPDGESFCVDATDPYSDSVNLPSTLQGIVSLAGDDVVSLPAARHRWRMNETLSLAINADGSVDESSRLDYAGEYAAWVRSSLLGLDADDRQAWLLSDYAGTISNQVEPTFSTTGIDSLEPNVEVSWSTRYDDLVDTKAALNYTESTGWLDQLLGFFASTNEHYDYEFEGMQYKGEIEVKVDPHWRLTHPGKKIVINTRFGSMNRDVEIDGNSARYTITVELPRQTVPVAELEIFRKFLTSLQEINNFQITGLLRPAISN